MGAGNRGEKQPFPTALRDVSPPLGPLPAGHAPNLHTASSDSQTIWGEGRKSCISLQYQLKLTAYCRIFVLKEYLKKKHFRKMSLVTETLEESWHVILGNSWPFRSQFRPHLVQGSPLTPRLTSVLRLRGTCSETFTECTIVA